MFGNLFGLGSKVSIVDQITITIKDKDGKIKKQKIINNGLFHRFLMKLGLAHNSMTNVGFAAAAGLIGNTGSVTAFTVIGIGTGTTAAAATDTALGTAIKLKAATVSRVQTTVSNDTLQLVATFSAALDSLSGTNAITEVGAFNGTTNGVSTMLLRQVYSPADTCNWDQGDTLQVTIKIQCKQGA